MLTQIQATWPDGRQPSDQHHDWNWPEICRGTPEAFCLVHQPGTVAAIWCGKHRPIRLAEKTFYRLDRFEVCPSYRGTTIGLLTFSIIAGRALELAADGLVLASLPAAVDFYRKLGGEQRKFQEWNVDDELIPFVFDKQKLLELHEDVDELIVR
ncbi:MAG TPA: hypothetical protein VFS67_14885 [Polyangiaceae bacterium]|jgi:hypothetical protein|nr:hypothetical protein [Polyangiaceae bacterium]